MFTTRKNLVMLLTVFSLCFISMYIIGSPAEAASTQTSSTSDDPGVVLAPAPTVTPSAALPIVKKAHKAGFIKACERTRRHGGRMVSPLQYGSFKYNQLDGAKNIRPGHCRLIRVHRHKIDWVAYDRMGRIMGIGHVYRIRL